MKITSFYPIISTGKLEDGLATYTEDFGFTVKRRLKYPGLMMCALQNENGDRVDILEVAGSELGFYSMHVNVEDFDEGLQYFQAKGYVIEDKVKKYGQGIPYVNLVKGANRITLSSSVGSM